MYLAGSTKRRNLFGIIKQHNVLWNKEVNCHKLNGTTIFIFVTTELTSSRCTQPLLEYRNAQKQRLFLFQFFLKHMKQNTVDLQQKCILNN